MQVEIATPSDNAALLGLLRDNPMRGEITLSFEREPDYFRAAAEGAAEAYPIIARDPSSGRIRCVAEVALRHVFVNGAPVRGAYLSNWRMDSAWRERVAFLETGLAFFANLQQERLRADVFYTAILAENTAARRRLERRRPGPGNYHLVDDLVTYLVPTRPLRRSEPGSRRLGAEDEAELRRFLAERLGRFQFASDWRAPELAAGTAPRADDFLVLRRDGAIVACAAIWDQRASKQVVVRDYSRRLQALRPLHNATARLTGKPLLPAPGTSLALASIAGFAVAENEPATAVALLDGLRRSGAHERGIGLLALTLSARHPAGAAIARRLASWTYRSHLYQVSMPDSAAPDAVLSERPSQPEAALL